MRRIGAVALIAAATLAQGWTAAARPPASCASIDSPVRLLVRIHQVRGADGLVSIVLYGDRPEEFLDETRTLLHVRVPSALGTVSACLTPAGAGRYAVVVHHDENADGRFNFSLIGLPLEGYGFSNDAPARFSRPSYHDAAFQVEPGETVLDIRMRY